MTQTPLVSLSPWKCGDLNLWLVAGVDDGEQQIHEEEKAEGDVAGEEEEGNSALGEGRDPNVGIIGRCEEDEHLEEGGGEGGEEGGLWGPLEEDVRHPGGQQDKNGH